jgi:hypothetical protein
VEWSLDGRGNYWSDHPAFDLNGDGIADSPFRPNDLMDRILWSQPAAGAADRIARRAADPLGAIQLSRDPAGRRRRQLSR